MSRSRRDATHPETTRQTPERSGSLSTTGLVYLRAPVLPHAHAFPITRSSPSTAAGQADEQDERDDLAEILRAVAQDPLVREALEVSSAALTTTLRRLERGANVQLGQLRRAAYAACRYLLRMSGRPTPFGLMAGVAAGHFAERGRVEFGSAHRKGVRPDSEWLAGVVNDLATRPDVLRSLRVCANDLAFERAGRIVLPYVPMGETTDQQANEASIRATAPARIALDAAATPIVFTDLVAHIADHYPQVSGERVERLVTELVTSGLLCTELSPPQHHTDPLAYVVSVLERTPAAETEWLRKISQLLDDYAQAPLGDGSAAFRAATDAMRELRSTHNTPVQVDLGLDTQPQLPTTVAREAERAASVLLRLSPPQGSHPRLRQYYYEFVDKYGLNNAVAIKDVLDPERGIGPPAGYQVPANSRLTEPDQQQWSLPQRRLAELAQQATLSGAREIVLDEATIADLEPPEKPATTPETTELNFELHSESVSALERGEFRLVCAPAMGMMAGGMLGRFAYLFDDHARLDEMLPPARDDRLRAQIAFHPLGGWQSNLTRVPPVLDRTLAIGIFDERGDRCVLGLDDVGIVGDKTGLRLVSLHDHRQILAISPQMLDQVYRTPNAVRLLREITDDGSREVWPWRWGELENLPYLPRVRYGRIVLSRARWRPSRAVADSSTDTTTWESALDRWREQWGVPDVVQARYRDHSVELDLTQRWHRRLFRDELRRKPDLVVTETARDGESDLGWSQGHVTEVVVPLAAPEPQNEHSARTAGPATAGPARASQRQVNPPGGEWVFAKLYSSPDRHDEILTEHLSRLLEAAPSTVDRWFFLRYTDPDHHLRLRCHGDADSMNQNLLPALHAWSRQLREGGLIRKMELSTYEPETDRYGGPAAIEAAERAFRADSEAVLLELRANTDAELPEEVLGAVNFADLLRQAEPNWTTWYENASIQHYHGMHRHVRQAVALLDDVLDETNPDTDAKTSALRAAFTHRAPAIGEYATTLDAHGTPQQRTNAVESLLHMHHNRLSGIDQDREQRVHAVASRIAATHRGRARAGRT